MPETWLDGPMLPYHHAFQDIAPFDSRCIAHPAHDARERLRLGRRRLRCARSRRRRSGGRRRGRRRARTAGTTRHSTDRRRGGKLGSALLAHFVNEIVLRAAFWARFLHADCGWSETHSILPFFHRASSLSPAGPFLTSTSLRAWMPTSSTLPQRRASSPPRAWQDPRKSAPSS